MEYGTMIAKIEPVKEIWDTVEKDGIIVVSQSREGTKLIQCLL